jgi:hypothetical protein
LNVTFTSDAPALDAPSTTTTLVADEIEHDAAAAPPTTALQTPPCSGVMKLAPVSVMELDWYPASGVIRLHLHLFLQLEWHTHGKIHSDK